MTLDEAKKKIESAAIDHWNSYKGSDKQAPPEQCGDESIKGRVYGLNEARCILEMVEPPENPRRMTLRELAEWLKVISDFRYLTYEKERFCRYGIVTLYWDKPNWNGRTWSIAGGPGRIAGELAIHLAFVNLSEYADEKFKVDYARCIVEVDR